MRLGDQDDVRQRSERGEAVSMAAPTLKRDYQQLCEDNVFEVFQNSGRALVVMPTGTGKTVTFATIADRWLQENPGRRVLIIAHRSELIYQAQKKLLDVTGLEFDVEMAEQTADAGFFADMSPGVVASVQTLTAGKRCEQCFRRVEMVLGEWQDENPTEKHPGVELGCPRCIEGRIRRMQKFHPDDFGLVIIDEAHHAVAGSYQMIIDYFACDQTHILGVTATPDRHDEESLGQIFHEVAFDYELPDAIKDGWLVAIEQQFVEVDGLDLSSCRKNKHGDMQDKDVANAMKVLKEEGELHRIVDPTIELAGDRKTLVFAASVDHAKSMAEIFNRHKPNSAEVLHGGTDKEIRQETLARFNRGEFQYLCNCSLFLEGFDEPTIGCVAVARPTASRALYAQIVGRGTRTLPGIIDGLAGPDERRAAIRGSDKPSVLVLDYVGNSGNHKLVTTADILGGNETDRVVAKATEIAKDRARNGLPPVDMEAVLDEARREVEEEEAKRKRRHVVAKTSFRTKDVNPFDIFDILPPREPGWHKGRKPSERQKEALRKFGVDDKTISESSFTQASKMLDTLVGRIKQNKCSLKQAKILRRHGFSADCTFEEASGTIDRIAKSGWKLRGDQ